MKRITIGLLLVTLAAGMTADTTQARGGDSWEDDSEDFRFRERSFRRVGTFANYLNNGADGADETVSEIIAATADGRTLVYTDGVRGTVGFIDITDPGTPQPGGVVVLDPNLADDVDYSPTSVDILGNQYALVAVNTSESFANPSGKLVVVDIFTRTIVREIELGGQPDSVQISPDLKYLAIVIENERNEDLCVGGLSDGLEVSGGVCAAGGGVLGGLPQAPAGFLLVLELAGHPLGWGLPVQVSLSGYSTYAPEDPEPEFVDINRRNEAVVTLQENNWIVIVDLETLAVTKDFDMGMVTIDNVDATEDGVISLSETLTDRLREPDAVAWIPGSYGKYSIATANEGDLFGGSRGFTIFRRDGAVAFDSGSSLEKIAVQHGHYPEDRSENKGTEPEAIEYGRFGKEDYLFVGSERGSFIAVYRLDDHGRPKFEQLLPGPLGPEGLLAIPGRNLLVASGETDLEGFNVRSTVMIYELKRGEPTYPQIVSDSRRSPVPWSALSGMVSVPWRPESLLAVWDSAYSQSNIFHIDVSQKPARVTHSVTITGGGGNYDPEGIAIAPDHTLWIASEGNASDSRQNLLIQTDFWGNVITEVGLPPQILACRAATVALTGAGTLGSGFEGVAVLNSHRYSGGYRLIVAQQRGWVYTAPGCEGLDDSGGGFIGAEPKWTRLWIYDPGAPPDERWSHIVWELMPKPENATWVGLSEITEVPGGDYILIERDNRTGDFAELKTLVKIDWHELKDGFIGNDEKAVYDLLPDLLSTNGWITDKPEGVAVTWTGQTYVVTDNDGVEDWNGETWFFDLGRYWSLFDERRNGWSFRGRDKDGRWRQVYKRWRNGPQEFWVSNRNGSRDERRERDD
jgi:hypothetical protein